MRIGVTDCLKEDKYNLYVQWVRGIEPDLDIVRLSSVESNAPEVARLDGLMLTGGGDVGPRFYGGAEPSPLVKDVNEQRDEFEFRVIESALENEVPILGVCRGMQVMNVHLGGSLYLDLQTAGFENHSSGLSAPSEHPISIRPHSMLHAIAGSTEAVVNSYHHQAVERLGKGLVETARTRDGVLEAAEWALKDEAPFLMLVQWHPERQQDSELSTHLAQLFLREVHRKRHNQAVR